MTIQEFYYVEHFSGQASLHSKGWYLGTIKLGDTEFISLGDKDKNFQPIAFIKIEAITRFLTYEGMASIY